MLYTQAYIYLAKSIHMQASIRKAAILIFAIVTSYNFSLQAQLLQLPDNGTNLKCKASRRLATTDIDIHWNAPGVKGREGKIWGTPVANYGFEVLGFGSTVASPWRAGADESTTIHFSTAVTVNGKPLAAGTYGFFIALYSDSCTLIFNKNTAGWGSYFYNSNMDVMRVSTIQQKDQLVSKERLEYTFSKHTKSAIEIALEWENWRIPFTVEVDLIKTGLASIQEQLSGAMGFDPPSLEAAARWCLQNNVNYEQALSWISSATDPSLGGVKNFGTLSTQAGLLRKLNRGTDADSIMQAAIANGNVQELHNYGRQLITEGKPKEALQVFELNAKKNKGGWPTSAGLMRGYSANGDLKKALEQAKIAVQQAPNAETKRVMEEAVKKLSEGKAL
jgi:tetratricopeptide (TPR) repeat protein